MCVDGSSAWFKPTSNSKCQVGSPLARDRVVKDLVVHLLVGHVAVDLPFPLRHSCSARISPADGFWIPRPGGGRL